MDLEKLTPREREVVDAAMRGGSVQSLAEALLVSPRTIEHHLSAAYRKVGVRNRTELLARVAVQPEPLRAPATHYARSGDAHLAYQVIGDGDRDIVLIPGFVSNVENGWTWPALGSFLRRLSGGRRLIFFDKRGTGLSDPVADPARLTLEERTDEVRAVMDAAGSWRATLFGFSEGAAMSMLFAATYPARTDGLILYGPLISGSLDPESLGTAGVFDDPDAAWKLMQGVWGTGQFLAPFGPSATEDPDGIDHVARFERHGASPAAAYAIILMAASIEVRALCPAVRASTLVLHRREDALVPVSNSRYLADHLPAARYVELDGLDHPPWLGESDRLHAEVDRFMATSRRPVAPAGGVLLTLVAADVPLDGPALKTVERFRGRPAPSNAGTLYTFDGPVRAAQCALALSRPERTVAVHAGEVRHTPRGLEGTAIDVVDALLAAAPAGTVVTSATLRELALGSSLDFTPSGTAEVRRVGAVETLLLRAANGPKRGAAGRRVDAAALEARNHRRSASRRSCP